MGNFQMDVGWGGVPRMVPSDTALRYLNDNVKVQEECDLPAGGHLRNRRIMEQELRGHKQGKLDLLDSFNTFYLQKTSPFGAVLTRSPLYRFGKPGAGLGWTEPRCESALGMVDRRMNLRGYVGGIKKRDSKFAGH